MAIASEKEKFLLGKHQALVHLGVFGTSLLTLLLSSPDRLSLPDRRSPINCFSTSERVSVPDRLSFEVRLSVPDRFSSSPIVESPLVAENHRGLNILAHFFVFGSLRRDHAG